MTEKLIFLLLAVVAMFVLYIVLTRRSKTVITVKPTSRTENNDVYINTVVCDGKERQHIEVINRVDFQEAIEQLFLYLRKHNCKDSNITNIKVLTDTNLVIETYIVNNSYYSPAGYYHYFLKEIYNKHTKRNLCLFNDAILEAKSQPQITL